MKSVKKTGSLIGRFAATLSVLATALIITACGGGGGGSATTPAVTPPVIVTPPVTVVDTTPPVLTFVTSGLPVGITATLEVTANEVVNNGKFVVTQKGSGAVVSGSTGPKAGSLGFTWTPAAPLAYATSYSVTATAQDLAGNVSTLSTSFSTGANPVTSTCNSATQKYESGVGACVNQPGVKVLKLNKLPAECQLNLDTCYTQKVADGTIQFAQSEISDLVFALYITFDNFTVAYPVHKSDGTPQNISRNLIGGGSNGSGVDWYAGSKNGVFLKASSTGTCAEFALNASKTSFGTTPVTCPN